MARSLIRKFCLFIPVLYAGFLWSSCSSTKKIKYFQDIPDSGKIVVLKSPKYQPPTIEVGDLLNISILLIDPTATSLINSGNTAGASSSSSSAAAGASSGGLSSLLSAVSGGNSAPPTESGYLVDHDGNIEMPILGKFKALGYTTAELQDIVTKLAAKYYKDPIIIVKYANFKVNILGEVLKPGQYIMPDENESIVDALAMAGDLTIFGKRENVLLFRDNLDGTRTAYRINLKKSDIMSAPYYYMRQNDVIYVEPRKAKSDATDASEARYITIAAAVLSVLIILGTRLK